MKTFAIILIAFCGILWIALIGYAICAIIDAGMPENDNTTPL